MSHCLTLIELLRMTYINHSNHTISFFSLLKYYQTRAMLDDKLVRQIMIERMNPNLFYRSLV